MQLIIFFVEVLTYGFLYANLCAYYGVEALSLSLGSFLCALGAFGVLLVIAVIVALIIAFVGYQMIKDKPRTEQEEFVDKFRGIQNKNRK